MSSSNHRSFWSALNPRAGYGVKPLGLFWRSSTLFITTTAGIGFFTDLFLYALVLPILPHILSDRATVLPEHIQSYSSALLAAYACASVILSPVAGIVADRTVSRQGPFLFGLGCLIISTVLLFTGASMPVFMIARIGQGASSAFVWSVGLTLCIDTVGPKSLGKIIGVILSLTSVGALFAPVIGGVLYERVGYGAVGVLAVSLLVVDFVMRLLVIEKKIAVYYIQEAGYTSGSEESEGHSQDATDEESPLLRKQSDPAAFFISPNIPSWYHKIPIAYPILHSASLMSAFCSTAIQAVLLGSFDATIPTQASDLFGFDSFKIGLLFVPLSAVNLVVGPIAGWCVDKYGPKVVAVTGFAFMVPALVLLRIPTAEPLKEMSILYAGLLALCGAALGMIDAPAIVEAGTVIDRYHRRNPEFFGEQGPYAQLYGLNSMVFSLGLTIGPELGGELKRIIGYGNMVIVLAVISGVNAIMCFVWLGGKPQVFKTD